MDDSIYTLKRYNKKKKKRSYKLLYLIIIVLSLLICFKKDNTLKNKFKQNFNFAKFNKLYESIFGEFFPEISSNEQEVFNEKLEYKDPKKYKEGVKLSVKNNYLVPVQESGLVVFIGKKEGYGNTIIVQQVNGVDLWYGNINNSNVKLYDYIEKGEILGDTLNNDLYLVYKKEGSTVNYEEYIKS